MKLITSEIKRRFEKYPLRSQDGDIKEAVCIAKFFLPEGAWTWYVTEADLDSGELFGVVINGYGDGEIGYFSLRELESLRSSHFQLPVERDKTFEPCNLKDIKDDTYLKYFLRTA